MPQAQRPKAPGPRHQAPGPSLQAYIVATEAHDDDGDDDGDDGLLLFYSTCSTSQTETFTPSSPCEENNERIADLSKSEATVSHVMMLPYRKKGLY